MKCIALPDQMKSNKRNYLLEAGQGNISLNILKNPWFTRFPSQITNILFPPAFLIASTIKFVCPNVNFELNSRTGSILHKNLRPPNNVTIIKFIIVSVRRCGFFTAFPKTIPL